MKEMLRRSFCLGQDSVVLEDLSDVRVGEVVMSVAEELGRLRGLLDQMPELNQLLVENFPGLLIPHIVDTRQHWHMPDDEDLEEDQEHIADYVFGPPCPLLREMESGEDLDDLEE